MINWKQEASIPATETGVTEARTQAAENESVPENCHYGDWANRHS
jgi:hypothetical protein